MYKMSHNEFKDIHNGLCTLNYTIDHLDNLLSNSVVKELKKAYCQINKGFNAVRKQESELFHKKSRNFSKIQSESGFISVWSIYSVDDIHADSNFSLDSVKQMWYEGNTIELEPYGKLSWLNLWYAADKLIRKSEDLHHIFIEEFVLHANKPDVLVLHTGS